MINSRLHRPLTVSFAALLECLARAALLAKPENIEKFLCTHMNNMVHSMDQESKGVTSVVLTLL
uniref:RIIa domain-containing protein n=1 Tax=Amphiprion ocellaris TaxID=80972 RepID=A0AAQ5YUJ3_AMPOC